MKKLLITATLLLGMAGLLMPGTVFADSTQQAVCAGIGLTVGTDGTCDETSGGSKGVSSIVTAAINVLASIVGVIAVVMIVIGGFKYVTSGGDSNAVGSAKSTIMYALIGLIVVAMSQVLIHFVLNKATTDTPPATGANTSQTGVGAPAGK